MNDEHSPAVPLGILAVAILLWSASVTWNLVSDNTRLKQVKANQETLVQNSERLRGSLDALASETAKLAAEGNPSARLLVDELRKRGITIKPSPPGAK